VVFHNGGSSRLFKNGVLRKILGPKGEKVTGIWRKVHYE
jgi:hypothetical protein